MLFEKPLWDMKKLNAQPLFFRQVVPQIWGANGSTIETEFFVSTVAKTSRPAALMGRSAASRPQCPGTVSKTLKQVMAEMVQDPEDMPDEQPGHRWLMRATNFSCRRCWAKIPLRSGKAVLEKLKGSECRFGRMTDAELNLRTRSTPAMTFGGGGLA